MKDLILKLCNSYGVSGTEKYAAEFVMSEMSKYAQTSIDKNGNIIATMGKMDSLNHIMLDAHLDQIGLVVTYIDENGFIKVAPCGGVDRRVLLGSAVAILGKNKITGIICCQPPHLSNGQVDKVLGFEDIYIDTGFCKDKVCESISIGDKVVFLSKCKELLNDRISSSGLDNRAGVAALIRCAEILSKEKLNCKVSFLFSVQEEIGAMGAETGAFLLTPSQAISVDVSFANQPFVPREKAGVLGNGPMIGIAPSLSNDITNKLIKLSKDNNIPYQLEVMSGQTGTNADKISITKEGIPCGLVSIPQRNMHTAVEIVDLEDIENISKLLTIYILDGGMYND